MYLKNVHISHTSLRGKRLSRLGNLGAGCGGDGASEELVPSKVSPNDDSCVASVASCSSTSPAYGTPSASDLLASGSEGLRNPLRTSAWELSKFPTKLLSSSTSQELKTGYREQSSNGSRKQIVFGSHSELGKCAYLSPEIHLSAPRRQLRTKTTSFNLNSRSFMRPSSWCSFCFNYCSCTALLRLGFSNVKQFLIYIYHIFITSSSSFHGFITNQFNDLFAVGLLA